MSVDVYTIGLDGGDEKRLTTEGFNDRQMTFIKPLFCFCKLWGRNIKY